MLPEYASITLSVIAAFEKIGIPYLIGGSLASAYYGTARATLDADLVAEIRMDQVTPLVEALKDEFYIDEDMIRSAVEHTSSFNLLHLPSMFKVDVFLLKKQPYDLIQFNRRIFREIITDPSRSAFLSTAEDIILVKLELYRMGGEVSDWQWKDVLSVLKVQAGELDRSYLMDWAVKLGVLDLLNRAIHEADL